MRFAANPDHWKTDWNGILCAFVAGCLGLAVGVASAKTAVIALNQLVRLDNVRLLVSDDTAAVRRIALAANDRSAGVPAGSDPIVAPWGND